MINRIGIDNFRSIQHTDIELQPLTVIVGANSTGKSNLIKALDFLSDIPKFGLQETLYKRGGIAEVLPKGVKETNNKDIKLEIEITLDPPNYWKHEFGYLTAKYHIVFCKTKRLPLKIKSESLKMKSVLLLSYFLDKVDRNQENQNVEIASKLLNQLQNTEITISRSSTGQLKYNKNFDLNPLNKHLLVNWLGIKKFFEQQDARSITAKNLNDVFKTLINTVRPGLDNKRVPILSTDRPIFGFSPQLRKLISEIQSIGRYDLLINELRQEQAISNSHKVSQTGDNIPSVVKKFIREEKKAWGRITTTMSNISPFFKEVSSRSLRAGKEYLVFKEIFEGRPIESWEASDGTLRALAILLSLESHKEGSTVLIEEPEHGLHPWAVKDLLTHIKDVIYEKNLQVILTTHSQQVLESLDKEELLITDRNKSGTTFSSVDDIMPDSNISMGEVGELWTRGLLKGVPSNY